MVASAIGVLIFVVYVAIVVFVISLLWRITTAIEKIAAKIENSTKL